MGGQGAGRGIGSDPAQAADEEQKAEAEADQAILVTDDHGQQSQPRQRWQPEGVAQEGGGGHPPQEPGIDLAGGDQGQGVGAEKPAKVLRRHPIELDEQEGRAGDVGEHARPGQAGADHVADKGALAE